MTWFMIRIEGSGMRVEIVGDLPVLRGLFRVKKKITIIGFYATRYIEAEDADGAIALVRSLVMSELVREFPQHHGSWNELVLRVDDIRTINTDEVDSNAKGFTFFESEK